MYESHVFIVPFLKLFGFAYNFQKLEHFVFSSCMPLLSYNVLNKWVQLKTDQTEKYIWRRMGSAAKWNVGEMGHDRRKDNLLVIERLRVRLLANYCIIIFYLKVTMIYCVKKQLWAKFIKFCLKFFKNRKIYPINDEKSHK